MEILKPRIFPYHLMEAVLMKKRWIIIAALYLYFELLAVLSPYLVGCLPPDADRWLDSNYLITLISLLLVPTLALLAAGILSAVFSLTRPPASPSESIALMKTQMVMRLAQIPGYVLIFFLSILFLITIWTAAFAFAFMMTDFASIIITGLFSIPVYVSLYQNGLISKKRAFCYGLLSFVFCADVIVSILCYRQVKDMGNQPRNS